MKKFSKAIALVSVTTLFATAFTTSYFDHNATQATPSAATHGSDVARIVITGKRMTAAQKAQFDAEQQNPSSAPTPGSAAPL